MIYLLIFISGVAKACMDTLQFHYYNSKFDNGKLNEFLNPQFSWKNKYKNGDKEQGERFFGSTTIFSFLTDGWHLFQSIFLTTLFASIVLYKPIFNYHEIDAIRMIADFVILRGVFGFGFVLFYNKLLLK